MEYRILEQKALAIEKESKMNKQEVDRLKLALHSSIAAIPSSPQASKEAVKLKEELNRVTMELTEHKKISAENSKAISQLEQTIVVCHVIEISS
jgi:predicted O-linked N-acetylglucosamine transferase (SPINDLY family)